MTVDGRTFTSELEVERVGDPTGQNSPCEDESDEAFMKSGLSSSVEEGAV